MTGKTLNRTRTADQIRTEISKLVEEYSEIAFANEKFKPGETPIPASGKVIDGDEIKNMVESSLDGWLTTGRFNRKFEEQLSKFLKVKHVLTVNSGSSANLVAFNTLTSPKLGSRAIKRGDEIITVAAGFPTTVNPILQFGAVPVFVDVNIGTYNVDVDCLESAITSKTKAIMLAHTLGNPFNLDVIKELCQKHNLWLVEDCCDALGSTYNGLPVGTFGDIATLSFYPAHHITMGEGGAVFTNNGKLKKIAESFRDWGRDCYCAPGEDNTCNNRFCWTHKKLGGSLPDGYDHKYTYSHVGYNLKITDMQASCGLAQLEKLPGFIEKRRINYSYLRNKLISLEKFLILPEQTTHSDPSWFGFPITLRPEVKFSRVELLRFLDERKIGTRLLFAGNLVRQPYMEKQNFRISGSIKNTEIIMNKTFWIGIFPGLDHDHLDYAVSQIEEFIRLHA